MCEVEGLRSPGGGTGAGDATPVGLVICCGGPRVGLRAEGQPWAEGRNPVGIGEVVWVEAGAGRRGGGGRRGGDWTDLFVVMWGWGLQGGCRLDGGRECSAVLTGKDPGMGSWRGVVIGNETDLFVGMRDAIPFGRDGVGPGGGEAVIGRTSSWECAPENHPIRGQF
jgi:hypothetical protein